MKSKPFTPPAVDGAEQPNKRPHYSGGRFHYELVGVRSLPFSDAYYFLMRTSWLWLLGLAFVGFVLINIGFALLYLTAGDSISGARSGSFLDAFYFSVQTFSTIGYGAMTPRGLVANMLATVESFAGPRGGSAGYGHYLRQVLAAVGTGGI